MKRELTCIGCPMGCRLTAEFNGTEVTEVTGNGCAVGARYAREELTNPKRMVTARRGHGTPAFGQDGGAH